MMNMSIEKLIKDGSRVYVKNNTRPKGHIVIQMMLPNGSTHPIVIPRTHLPICLNDFVSSDVILQSHDLRQYLSKNVITLVDPKEAERLLADPEAKEELERLRASEFSASSAFVSERVSAMENVITQANAAQNAAFAATEVPSDQITPRVLDIVNRLLSKDLSIKGALGELKAMEEELTAADCAYIITNGPDGQIKQYVQSVLANIKSGVVAAPAPTQPANKVPSEYDLRNDDMSDLTEEERMIEEQREAAARAQQKV
jgi:hypothetical protein